VNSIKIGYFRNNLLQRSETFIYRQIKNHKLDVKIYGIQVVNEEYLSDIKFYVPNIGNDSHLIKKVKFSLAKIGLYVFNDLIKKIREDEIDLIHIHFGPDALQGFRIAHKLKLPFIVTIHGYDATRFKPDSMQFAVYLLLKKYILEKASYVIAVSHFIENALKKVTRI